VHVTYRPVRWEDVEEGRGSVIGRAIPGWQIYVLSEGLEPCPIGVPGELYVGGAGLARGYLHRAELTGERFVPNPFGQPGERLYKTGDLARYRGQGELEYLGRIDQQVKVRGFRIELGEIEARLRQVPGIQACTVQVQEEAGRGKRLVGYVVEEEGERTTTSQLRRQLQEVLPEYMVPSVFVSLASLPLTPNGKLDRRALPLPDQEGIFLHDEFVEPRDAVEEFLADIWKEVLGLERISVYDNFFEIGGHSLLATQLLTYVRQSLNIDIPLRDLFEKPTLADFAEHLQKLSDEVDDEEAEQMLDELEQLSQEEAQKYLFESNS
jgi:acyl carrier protein